MVTVTLQILGLHVESEHAWAHAEHCFPDVWACEHRVATVAMQVSHEDVVGAVLRAVEDVEARFPEIWGFRVARELVSTSDIAHRLRLPRETIRKWSLRPGFPAPLGTVGRDGRPSKVWHWSADLCTWLGRMVPGTLGADLPDDLTMALIDVALVQAYKDRMQPWMDFPPPKRAPRG